MIKVTIEIDGPDGRLETEAIDPLGPRIGTSASNTSALVQALTEAALRKIQAAIEA